MIYLEKNFLKKSSVKKAIKAGQVIKTSLGMENGRGLLVGGLDTDKRLAWVGKATIANGTLQEID